MIRTEPVGHIRCQWGEAPIWWQGALYFVDIEGHRVHRYDPADDSERSWDVGQRVGTVVPRESGGLVIAGDHGFQFLDEETGELTAIADPEPDKPDNRFNDGKCSPDGRFFAGTISLTKKNRQRQTLPARSRSHASTKPSARSPLPTASSGPPMAKPSITSTPRAAKCSPSITTDGHLRNLRSVVATGHIDASPDGMTLDADGHLWIAFCHGGCVSCFDPHNGNELHRIALPCLGNHRLRLRRARSGRPVCHHRRPQNRQGRTRRPPVCDPRPESQRRARRTPSKADRPGTQPSPARTSSGSSSGSRPMKRR